MTRKTYTAVKGEKPFNWFHALSEDCAKMQWEEARALSDKAGNWTTCACGNQCAVIPREEDGRPRDRALSNAGVRFWEEVDAVRYELKWEGDHKKANRHRLRAIAILHKIEARAAVLIAKILKEKKKGGAK